MASKNRIWCPTCGDVTTGHPEMDKAAYKMFSAGFTVSHSNL